MSDLTPKVSDPVQRREAYTRRIHELIQVIGLTQEQLDRKIDRQLETEGGIDALGFDGLQKVIAWLEGKRESAGNGNA